MSSIPFARGSTVNDLIVVPEKWESYPFIDRSTIQSCIFQNLTSATSIQRSTLNAVTLQSHNNKGSYISRCQLADSVVTDSNLKHCGLSKCVMDTVRYAKWMKAQGSHVAQVPQVKRCVVEESSVINTKFLKWSTIKASSVINSGRLKRATLQGVRAANSVIDRSNLTNCEVTNCEIYRTHFTGMIIENGIWKNGQLVGKTNDKEVIIRPRSDTDKMKSGPSHAPSEHQRVHRVDIMNSTNFPIVEPIPVSIIGEKTSRVDEKRMALHSDSDSDSSTLGVESDDDDDGFTTETAHLPPPPPYNE